MAVVVVVVVVVVAVVVAVAAAAAVSKHLSKSELTCKKEKSSLVI